MRKRKNWTMAEKRYKVKIKTHKWCRGSGGCEGKGYLRGKDGVILPHGPCHGDGLIALRRTTSDHRRGRSKVGWRRTARKARNKALAGVSVYAVASEMFGAIGSVVAILVIVLVTVLTLHRVVTR